MYAKNKFESGDQSIIIQIGKTKEECELFPLLDFLSLSVLESANPKKVSSVLLAAGYKIPVWPFDVDKDVNILDLKNKFDEYYKPNYNPLGLCKTSFENNSVIGPATFANQRWSTLKTDLMALEELMATYPNGWVCSRSDFHSEVAIRAELVDIKNLKYRDWNIFVRSVIAEGYTPAALGLEERDVLLNGYDALTQTQSPVIFKEISKNKYYPLEYRKIYKYSSMYQQIDQPVFVNYIPNF